MVAARFGGYRNRLTDRAGHFTFHSLCSHERDVNLDITARCGGVHSGNNFFNIPAQDGPLLIAEHDKSNFPARQDLLIPHIFIGRQQKFEACGFGRRYQVIIHQPVPSVRWLPQQHGF
jgi:hypothetical protein